jgi:ATP-dependent exoDNAse (exonuclease V) beta subunit
MSDKQPSDHAVRARAIDPSQSYLVQAPAGSGKTELLTDRILALLATVQRPEEIVAITFTRKAASEMHARVLAKLRAGKGERPAESYKQRSWELARAAMRRNDEMGWNLLEYPARLSIRTIDAFCAYLVRAMPWLSALGGVPAITDNAMVHYRHAALATLQMADDSPPVQQLLAHLDVDVNAACELLAQMLASRDQWLPLLAAGQDVDHLMDNLEQVLQADLQRLADAMPTAWAPSLAGPLSRAANVLAGMPQAGELSPLTDWQGDAFEIETHDLPRWRALGEALLTAKNELRRTVTIRQGFEAKSDYKEQFLGWLKAASGDEPWVRLLGDMRHAPDAQYTEEQERILNVLIQNLWIAAAQLKLQFAQAAEVDFIEIAQCALAALGQADDPSDLLLRLDMTIRHVLVDEFQDTSQTQIELLKKLTSGWMTGDGRTLFLVGDPMQSIYRFRKAEVGLFLDVKKSGLGEVILTPLELKDNFRSQAGLVQWVNDTCLHLFPGQDNAELGAISYNASNAFHDQSDHAAVCFHPVWVADDADDEGGQAATSQAEALAVELARKALEQFPHSAHPVAILVRARSNLDDVVRRLALADIPCRAVDLVSLQSRQVVTDMVQLARVLSHAGDRLAWLSVLRSPLCGLRLDSLHALFGSELAVTVPILLRRWLDAPQDVPLDEGEAARLRKAAAILLDAGNVTGSIPFAAWLEQCWERLGGPSIYFQPSDAADAESLLRLIETLAPYGALDCSDLESRLAQLYAAPRSSGRAVEVMTIHKSKGLEFETVILAGLHRKPPADRSPLLRFEHVSGRLLIGPIKHRIQDEQDPVSAYLAERDKKRAYYETDRLLYVALTRARQQLHLIAAVDIDQDGSPCKPPGSTLLGRLWDYLDLPTRVEPVSVDGALSGASERPLDEMRSQRYLVRPVLHTDSLKEFMLTAAQSAQSAHSGQSGQFELFGRADTVAQPSLLAQGGQGSGTAWQWRSENDDERLVGIVAHAWLERIGKDGLDAWSLDRLQENRQVLQRQLRRAGLSVDRLDQSESLLYDTLAATLGSEKGRWLLTVASAHREWSLLDASGRVSVIDLAISQEQGWLIVDYKTGCPGEGEPVAAFAARMRERYRDQIERYCAHVSALDGRPARGALYFPRVDVWVDV